jgi:hypothetical protein
MKEVSRLYSEDEKLSLFFVDKRATYQSFIRIEDDNVEELMKEVSRLYSEDEKLSLFFVDKRATCQSFIRIEDDNSYRLMLSMYEEEKKNANLCYCGEDYSFRGWEGNGCNY